MASAPQARNPVWRALIWLLAAIAALTVAGLAWFVYEAAYSPRARVARGHSADALKLAREAATAPGTTQLRAAGCADAWVLDLAHARALGIDPGHETVGTVILCRASDTAPDCAELARVYAAAVPTASPLLYVNVRQSSEPREACRGTFNARAGADGR